MSKQDDGGPAFARPPGGSATGQPGMSLRDWFAGQALIGIIAQVEDASRQSVTKENTAQAAYNIADAMLAERSKP